MTAFDPVHDALASNENTSNEQQSQFHQNGRDILNREETVAPPAVSESTNEATAIIHPATETDDEALETEPEVEVDADITNNDAQLSSSTLALKTSTSTAENDLKLPPTFADATTATTTTTTSGTPQSSPTSKNGKQLAEMGDHITISQPGKPTILKHKLNTSNKTSSKKMKKPSQNMKISSSNVISSARSRHLKKDDGQPFWRRDIQYEFLTSLFDDDIKAFTDPFPESKDHVNIDGRKPSIDGKLSFAELYIKSIAHSSKCSKVLKDRLLNDMKMSIPTCMICLLVNVGRMNTTINFVPDMKSQLRTYHSIPSLQVNYDTGSTIDKNDKQLQDTPRLKSILKACCDDTNEPNGLHSLLESTKVPKTNVINLIFILCNSEDSITKRFFNDKEYGFFDLFMNPKYNPKERSTLFLWLVYNYLETQLDEEGISNNPFGEMKQLQEINGNEFDIDTPEELEFGKLLFDQRLKFLAHEDTALSSRASLPPSSSSTVSSSSSSTAPTDASAGNGKDGKDPAVETAPIKTTANIPLKPVFKKDDTKTSTRDKTPHKNHGGSKTTSTTVPSGTPSTIPILPPPQVNPPSTPILRQDIDVVKIRRLLKTLRNQNYRKRSKRGLLVHEMNLIKRENDPEPKEYNNRLRLNRYKGDYVEYTTKFRTLFNLLKSDYVELNKTAMDNVKCEITTEYEDASNSLKLKKFDIGL